MAHTYEQLKHMTLADLREIAKDTEHDAVQGYTQMNKDHLIGALKHLIRRRRNTTKRFTVY
jgi:rubrerythrin